MELTKIYIFLFGKYWILGKKINDSPYVIVIR